MKILVIIPCYNEQDTILDTVQALKSYCPEVDCIVINDCSTDRSEEILRQNNIPFLSLPCNLGIGGGVQAGYLYAKEQGYDITIQMDGDGQHDPAYLRQVLQPLLDGQADMVIGSRFLEKKGFQTSFARRMEFDYLAFLFGFSLANKFWM